MQTNSISKITLRNNLCRYHASLSALTMLTVAFGNISFAHAGEPEQKADIVVNDLLNGGFENGMSGWEIFPVSARAEIDNELAHGGESSLKLTNKAGVSSRAWQTIQVNEDGPFEINFSCQMRRAEKDPLAAVGIDFVVLFSDGTTRAYFWKITGGSDDWVSNNTSKFLVEEPIESIEVYLLIYCGDEVYPIGTKEFAEPETAWFDDVVVNIKKLSKTQ